MNWMTTPFLVLLDNKVGEAGTSSFSINPGVFGFGSGVHNRELLPGTFKINQKLERHFLMSFPGCKI